MIISKYLFEAQILVIHDLNIKLNNLSSKVLSLYFVFDVQNLDLCLTRELLKFLDYKIMLTLECKTTFNFDFVGKKFIYEIYTCIKKNTVTKFFLYVLCNFRI